MTYAHVGYITKFLWGQRRPPGDPEIEQSILPRYLNPTQNISLHHLSYSNTLFPIIFRQKTHAINGLKPLYVAPKMLFIDLKLIVRIWVRSVFPDRGLFNGFSFSLSKTTRSSVRDLEKSSM